MSFRRQSLPVVAIAIATLAPVTLSATDEEPVERAMDEAVIVVPGESAVIRSDGAGRFGAYGVRNEVDPQDGVERLALLLPSGPLIVVVTMTLDRAPFRAAREALIDDMLAVGDTNSDGILTWNEALQNSRFSYGRIFPDRQRAQYLDMLDHDEDGEVSRNEARGFLAIVFQGPAFLASGGLVGPGSGRNLILANGRAGRNGGITTNVWALLDSDNDGVLSETEMAAAGERLRSRDTDDNDLLYTSEIGGGVSWGNRTLRVNRQRQQAERQQVLLLGPTAGADTLFEAIRSRYLSSGGRIPRDRFVGTDNPFVPLDADGNGILSTDEVMLLNEMEPNVRLAVDLSRSAGQSTLTLTYLEGGRKSPDDSESRAVIHLPGVTVTFEVNAAATVNPNYKLTAQRMLKQHDRDNNGYLELSELPENFERQFASWDADADGRVYAQDIVDGYTRSQVPQQTQIQAGVTQSGDPLFPALDLSGDSRLSLREMKTAHLQLASLDADGDGQLTQAEVPASYAVNFRIGNGGYNQNRRVAAERGRLQTPLPPTGNGPVWFVRMDRNGDGDVTIREFLGERSDFERLDSNSDGFIEPGEAKAAEAQQGRRE